MNTESKLSAAIIDIGDIIIHLIDVVSFDKTVSSEDKDKLNVAINSLYASVKGMSEVAKINNHKG